MKEIIFELTNKFHLIPVTYNRVVELENNSVRFLFKCETEQGVLYQLHRELSGEKLLVTLDRCEGGLEYIASSSFLNKTGTYSIQLSATTSTSTQISTKVSFSVENYINATLTPTPEETSEIEKLIIRMQELTEKAEILAEKAETLESLSVTEIDNGINVSYEDKSYNIVNGLDGQPGPKGDKGDKGDVGAQGERGLQGEQGIPGVQGERGTQGERGEKGDKGDKGEPFKYSDFTEDQLKALTGPKGDKGDTGEKGATGAQGIQGIQGIPGPQGEQGIQGVKGDKGDSYTITEEDYDAIASRVDLSGVDTRLDTLDNETLDLYQKVENKANTSDVYDKEAVNSLLEQKADVGTITELNTNLRGEIAKKQDILTPGTNITIENNIISATGSSSGVSDVQVNGTSIINDGVANIPYASNNDAGVVMTDKGFLVLNGKATCNVYTLEQYESSSVSNYSFISKGTLENVLSAKVKVGDVQINGNSIAEDGVAKIPIANTSTYGVVKPNDASFYTNNNGQLFVNDATESYIDNRTWNTPITSHNLDIAIRKAMCDGKGAAWSNEEKSNAQERMGIANATDTTSGLVKTAMSYGIATDDTGHLRALSSTKEAYQAANSNSFISKGTLENIFTTEEWTFTLADGSVITRKVVIAQ